MADYILSDWNAPPKTVSEAARWLKVDEHKIYDAINAHELPRLQAERQHARLARLRGRPRGVAQGQVTTTYDNSLTTL